MRRVVWADGARDDMISILEYISEDNPQAARAIVQELERSGNGLSHMATGQAGRVANTYELVVPRIPYILAYKMVVAPDGEELIVILRVIHGARDWPKGTWPKN